MARPKIEVDEKEVDEIINLKLNELSGVKGRLTYNNVWNFNKELVKNKILNYKGNQFRLYGYTFWAATYNGIDYIGKQKIDEIKSQDSFILAGKEFVTKMQDLIVIFDKYGTDDREGRLLREKILRLFEKDRIQMQYLQKELEVEVNRNKELSASLTKFQDDYLEMFFESNDSNNSLPNVMQLSKSGDEVLKHKLTEMFPNRLQEIERKNVSSLSKKKLSKRYEELEGQGF